jgi:hypothetical protein
MEQLADPAILVLVRDLMFSGRIGAEARAAGANVKMLRDPKALAEGPAEATRLIVDLDLAGALEAAAAWKALSSAAEVIAFVAHTNADAIRAARAAGFDQILTRGQFVEVLPRLLSREG